MDATNFIGNNTEIDISEIALIFVLYNPSNEELDKVRHLASLYYGYIVDNSEQATFHHEREGNMFYIFNNGNNGIGTAQNIALRKILNGGRAKYVVFFDQDSNVADSYPMDIVKTYKELKNCHPNMAFLGPSIINKTNGIAYQSIFHKDKYVSADLIERRELISSGSCIGVDVLESIGFAEEKLFLDFVDYEWCWRAKAKGFVNGVTPKLNVKHKVGNKDIYIGNYEIIISSPFRYYYQYRNHLWLLRKKYVPLQWKLATGIKMLLRMLYFPFCVNEWKEIEKSMFRGIYHGLFKSKI